MRVFTVIFVFFALLPLRQQAFAKCAFAKYTITGALRDESTGQAVSSATLFFFFNDYKSTLSEGYKTKYPDFFITNTNGVFVGAAFFDTYSGFWLFDRCNRKPKLLTVVITAPGYLTKRVIFKRKDFDIREEASDYKIGLPPITLRPSRH